MVSDVPAMIDNLIADCEKCAATYEQSPGLVQPATIVDIYRTIARLATLLKHSK